MTVEREKHPLVSALEDLAVTDNRAALAALRRGLSDDGAGYVYPYVAPYFPARPDPRAEQVLVQVAALFALHPGTGGSTLGRALRRVADETGSPSIEQRFVALLNAHPEDLHEHLRHAVALCRSRECALDWDDLLRTALWWGRDEGRGARHWARDYWTAMNKETET